jgi:hypothetical protein
VHQALVIVLVLLVFAVVLFAAWWFGADQQARRFMKGIPVRPIREVMDGEVARVVGAVSVDAPVSAPLSGRPCAYWRVVVEERRRRGKNSRWVTVIDDHGGVDFVVSDETGRALVKTGHVRAVLDKDHGRSSGFLNDATPELDHFLASRGHTSQGFLFNKSMRFREGVVEPGETVAVVGAARWEPDPELGAQDRAGYRDRAKRLVLDRRAEGPLLLSDEEKMTR